MQTKLVTDGMVLIKDLYSIPMDTVLNEHTILEIYRSGYSRVPCTILVEKTTFMQQSEVNQSDEGNEGRNEGS